MNDGINTTRPNPSLGQVRVRPAIELWFFRDLTDEQRYKLAVLCGLPGEAWPASQHAQRLFLRTILSALDLSPPVVEGGAHHGYVFQNPDTGTEYSANHPVESGEVEDAYDIRLATYFEDHLVAELRNAKTTIGTLTESLNATSQNYSSAYTRAEAAEAKLRTVFARVPESQAVALAQAIIDAKVLASREAADRIEALERERAALRDERDSLSSIVSSGIDDVAGAALDDAESALTASQAEASRLREALEVATFSPWLRDWCRAHFGKRITHRTANSALADLNRRAALSSGRRP